MSPSNRYEASTIQALTQALAGGLDPQQGLSIWTDLQNEYEQRRQQQQAAQAQKLDALRQLAVGRAQQGVPFDQVQTEFQGLMPNMGPKLQAGLDDTMTALYPSGVPGQLGRDSQYSTLAPAPDPVFKPFDASDMATISQTTAKVISDALASSAAGQGMPATAFPSLEDVTNQVAVNFGPVYDYHKQEADAVIQEAYQRMGGSVAAPPSSNLPFLGGLVNAAQQASGAPNRLGYPMYGP